MASVNRVLDLLALPIPPSLGNQTLDQVKGEVRFEQITFAYPGRHPAVQDLSLLIPAGQTIGIVGATGSGKSTLAKLLLRFYELQQGQIFLDGVEIRQLQRSELRRHLGWVSQEVFLFPGTVAENITYGSFSASEDDVRQAAKLAEAHEFIIGLPQAYDTIIGERGQKLSGGQRQRLAIARAVLKNPPILILDEATSAVDNETEVAIQRSLAQITQNRTTIAIAHRLSTIRNADQIYVIDQGRILEQGTHEQLLTQQGAYARLWSVQSGVLGMV
jgi:ATP-binding cassette, subfamily B, bacterial